jgi:hypothetical protein
LASLSNRQSMPMSTPTLWIDGRYPAAVADAEPTGVIGQSPYNQFTHAKAFTPVDLKVVVRPMRYFQVAAEDIGAANDSQRPFAATRLKATATWGSAGSKS